MCTRRVSDRIELKESQGKILQICHSQGRVKVEKTKIVENGIQADGIVFMKILYITGNDEMPFYSVDGMIPFSHIIEANGINEDSIFFLQADLEQLSTSMIDSNEIEVKAVISLNVENPGNAGNHGVCDEKWGFYVGYCEKILYYSGGNL